MVKLAPFVLILFVVLMFRFYSFYNFPRSCHSERSEESIANTSLKQVQRCGAKLVNGQKVEFSFRLLSDPVRVGNYQIITYRWGLKDTIKIYLPRYPEYHYGDELSIKGVISIQTQRFSTQSIKVPATDKIVKSIYFPSIEGRSNQSSLTKLFNVRKNITSFFNKSLSGDHAGLLLGIVFGIKQSISNSFMNDLRSAGVVHVVAASGMNVSMVASFLVFILQIILRRQIALVFAIFGILIYVVLAGFEASILRAAIMSVFVIIGQVIGRQTLPFFALLLAGIILLIFSPPLLFDIGFQLSFLSTSGLLVLPKYLKIRFLEKTIINQDLTTTLAAQIATYPIILFYFGSYSFWSVLVNILVLWTIPILMVIGGLGAVVSLVLEPLGRLFLVFSIPFLYYFVAVVRLFAHFPGVLHISYVPWQLVLGYYLLLIGSILYLRTKNSAAPEQIRNPKREIRNNTK